jgi:dGTP triphosphohydrolase
VSPAAWLAALSSRTSDGPRLQQPGLEAQLANLADEIAYNAHDIDDGVRSGLLSLEQLEDVELFAQHCRETRLAHRGCKGGGFCLRPYGACSARRSTT